MRRLSTGSIATCFLGACAIRTGIARDVTVGSMELPESAIESNLDSAIIHVDSVVGARDYRAFAMRDGVEVTLDNQGHELVSGATIYCAGQRQHAAPALPIAEVSQQIEVTDLHQPTSFVVEALDRLCPFPGIFGPVAQSIDVISNDAQQYFPELVTPVPILDEAAIRARYGSMIVNGQGPGSPLGQPAAPDPPIVLARWTATVSPLDPTAAAARRTTSFFDDFEVEDPPVLVPGGDNPDGTFHAPDGRGYSIGIFQSSRYDIYATNTMFIPGDFAFFDRSQLHTVVADASQAVSGAVMVTPRTLAHLPDTDGQYLHITFETSANSTGRRYWSLSLCGAEVAGQTFGADGLLSQYIVLVDDLFRADSPNPSVAGWNCLFLMAHDGIATHVPTDGNEDPESSIIVFIHRANANPSEVDVSPQQLDESYPRAWYREQQAGQVTEIGILDDLLDPAPRGHFDVYLSRNRLVLYVQGQQRLCNDFGAEHLTMAEAAVSLNDLLNHSSAEHGELVATFADRTGQLYYLNDTIFADLKTWDNFGWDENVALPATFSDADCYTHVP